MLKEFPVQGILPKLSTQAAQFIAENPEFDGRDTVIAILDTGVDPGAVGMQVTTTGAIKCLHLIDCTGSGDVPCTHVVEPTVQADGSRTIVGLSGRTLKIPSNWPAARDNKYRLGCKAMEGMFPDELVDRLKEERKRKFDVEHDLLVSKIQDELIVVNKDSSASARVEDLKVQLEVLKDQIKSFEDPGSVFDCIVFHTGQKWVAAVDVTEVGDLNHAPLLAGYSEEHQYASFGTESMLNFSVNIYNEGELLSIVTVSGTHGTHVASIAASNHPDDPRLNGVAPGAQIISLKVSDARLGTQETGMGFVRAAIEICRLKPDVANISFGEDTASNEIGRIVELLRDETVNKAGCIVLSSAGNSGPVLSSVSHPGGISGIITVGAYQTADMQDALYMMLENVPERPHTWSSRGPTLDGAAGPDFYSPGAAFTSVPQYTTERGQMMNGTSMACPNAAGLVSLLVSGLKHSFLPYNPYRVALALRNTSKSIDDEFNIGFVQVKDAWNHLTSHKSHRLSLDVHYSISVNGVSPMRGVYLKEVDETSVVQRKGVKVIPVFSNKEDPATNPLRLQYQAQVTLKPTKDWISSPEFVILAASGREFGISVDPTQLSPGLHFGEIEGFDTATPEAGPIFRVPITVCKPEVPITNHCTDVAVKYTDVVFNPGTIVRKFIAVPSGSNFAEIIIRSKDRVGKSRLFIHSRQLRNLALHSRYENFWLGVFGSTTSGVKEEESYFRKVFPVIPNVTTELVLGQMWNSLGDTVLSIEIVFHGLELSASIDPSSGVGTNSGGDLIFLNTGNDGMSRVDLRATIRKEDISPSILLESLRRTLRPASSAISVMMTRDMLPDSRRLKELVLTYTLKVSEDTTVTPFYSRTKFVLYDSVFENYLLQIFDGKKSFKSIHDIKGKGAKLSKGKYTIRVQLVSVNLDLLESLKNTPITVDFKLSKAATMSIYPTLSGMIVGDGKVKTSSLEKGESLTFFVAPLEGSSLPKGSGPGDLLMGKFNLTSDSCKTTTHQVAYIVPVSFKSSDDDKEVATTPGAKLAQDSEGGEKAAAKKDAQKISEAVRDLEISWLRKMTDDEERNGLIARLERDHAGFLPLLVVKLEVAAEKFENLDKPVTKPAEVIPAEGSNEAASSGEKVDTGVLDQVDANSKAILERVDVKELAVYYGTKADARKPEEGEKVVSELKKQREAEKSAVLLAQAWRARVLIHRMENSSGGSTDEALMGEFEGLLNDMAAWLPSTPTSDPRYLRLWVWRLLKKSRQGQALQLINKYVSDSDVIASLDEEENGEEDKRKRDTYHYLIQLKGRILEQLGWDVWRKYEERWRVRREPPGSAFAPF